MLSHIIIYTYIVYKAVVDEEGTVIGHPPIHIHHMHVGPVDKGATYVRQRTSPILCLLTGASCFYPDRMLETHGTHEFLDHSLLTIACCILYGIVANFSSIYPDVNHYTYIYYMLVFFPMNEPLGDYNCLEVDGGNECHFESFPEGFGKFVNSTIGIEGELNDVR